MQDRFLTEFSDQDAMDDEADTEEAPGQAKGSNSAPAEHEALFAGNTDDHFRLGIKITRLSCTCLGAVWCQDEVQGPAKATERLLLYANFIHFMLC